MFKQIKKAWTKPESREILNHPVQSSKELSLWKGPFGDQYRDRNIVTEDNLQKRFTQWTYTLNAISMFGSVKGLPASILEVGCGAGINLLAIEKIYRVNNEMVCTLACEPNADTRQMAMESLRKQNMFPIWLPDDSDALNLGIPDNAVDLAFTSGVLIHIHPDNQLKAMRNIYQASKKYIVCMEYFSPDLREITYHNEQALWTRDYGSLWLDNFNVRAIACMFAWKRMSGLDNITTWVFEKVN